MVYSMPANLNYPFEPSTIENIDSGVLEYVDEVFDIRTTTNNGLIKVPVIWLSAERAFQAKNDRGIRDSIGKLKLPIISVERTSIEKDKTFKGSVQAHIEADNKGLTAYKSRAFPITKKLNQAKTRVVSSTDVKKNGTYLGDEHQDNFPFSREKRLSERRVIYEEISIPLPSYITVMYTINLRAEYQQQINDMLTSFITKTGQLNHFVIEKNKHRYEAFIQQNFSQNNNLANMAEDERMFHTKVEIKVLGYLNGDGTSDPKPKITTKENIVILKMSRERVVAGDEIPWKTKDKKYRE